MSGKSFDNRKYKPKNELAVRTHFRSGAGYHSDPKQYLDEEFEIEEGLEELGQDAGPYHTTTELVSWDRSSWPRAEWAL